MRRRGLSRIGSDAGTSSLSELRNIAQSLGKSQVDEMNNSLTTVEAFRAMLIFLDCYYERGGRRSEDIATLLSGISQTVWADGSTNDPAQWADWLAAVQASKNQNSG